jgi:TetR/AcrR family transcriptional repressor of nem operon
MARPRQFDSDAALDRAVQAFWAGGYEATSVDDLCAAMGVRPGSLYGAFGGKRALFLKALEVYAAGSQAAFAEACRAGGLEGVRAFFGRLIDRLSDDSDGGRGCLVTNGAAELARDDAAVAEAVERHWLRLGDLLAELLRQAAEDGELAPGVGPGCATALVCLAQGMNVMAKTRPGRARLQDLVDSALAPMIRRS